MAEEKLRVKIEGEYLNYMYKLGFLSKSELYDNLQWLTAVQTSYEQFKEFTFQPDDIRMLLALRNPLDQMAEAYMRVYDAEAFALTVGGGLYVINSESEKPLPNFPSADAGFVKTDDPDKAAYLQRLDSEYASYRKSVMQQSREQMIDNAESIAMRQAVYGAMKAYPYHKDELAVVSALESPLKAVGDAVDKEDSTDALTKADIFDFSLAYLQKNGSKQSKKKRHESTR